MRAQILIVLLSLVGCGRVGFDALSDDDGGRTYLFQDGFEDTLDPWSPLSDVVVDPGPPAPIEGVNALRAQAGNMMSSRAEVLLSRTVTRGSVLYVRAYYYLPSGYPLADLSLLEIVQARFDNLVIITSPELGIYNTIDSTGSAGTYVVPRDVWFCMEVRVGIDNIPNGSIDISIDGTLRYSATSIETFTDGIDELHAGVTWAGASQPTSVVYVDDVIADDAGPIGCR